MQGNLSCNLFYFLESFFEFFWAAFSHTVEIDIAFQFDTTPSKYSKLEYHAERIANSPIENPKGITRTENTCGFAFEEFTRKNKGILGILIRESSSKYGVKEILQNCWHIHMPDREDKHEFISSSNFCLNSFPNRIRFFHIALFFVIEISELQFCRVEIEQFNSMAIFFFRLFVCFCYCMSKSFRAWMSGDNERMHKLSVGFSNVSQFEKDFRGVRLYDLVASS